MFSKVWLLSPVCLHGYICALGIGVLITYLSEINLGQRSAQKPWLPWFFFNLLQIKQILTLVWKKASHTSYQ